MSGRLKLRRGVIVDEDPLTVEVDGERRAAWADTALLGEMREGDEVVVNVAALDLGLGSGGLRHRPRQPDPRARGRGRGRRARDEAQLQLPPAPGRAGRATARGGAEARRGATPVLVLPLHGHLAPAAWAAAQASPGAQGRLRADRRRRRCRGRSAATPPSCSSAACSAATSPPPRPTAARRRRSRSPAPSTPPPTGFGWDAVLAGPGPGIIGSETRLGHGGIAALDTAHAALALGMPTLLSPRLSSADARERHRGVSHHTLTVMQLLLGAVEVPVPAGGGGPDRRPRRAPAAGATVCARCRSTSPDTPPAAFPRGRWVAESTRTRCSSPPPSPRAAPCAARDEPRPPEPLGMASRAAGEAGRREGGDRPPLRGPGPRLPLLPGARARPLAQHAERLPDRPPPVRRVPRRARDRRADDPAGRDLRLPRRARHRQRPPALLGGDDPPQVRLPALLLQAPAPRRADRRRPDGRDQHAAPGEEAAARPQLRRGPEAAGLARAATSRRRSATGPCSR